MLSSRHLSLAIVAAIALLVASAGAQTSSGDTALAEALFRDGRTLMKSKKHAAACPKFEESYRLVPKLGTLLNLAACHDEQGKTGSAWGEYTRAITEAKAAGEDGRVAFARKKLFALEERLSQVIIEVPSPEPGIAVAIGDQTIRKAAWGTPIPLDPGRHALTVSAPGHNTLKLTLTVPEGPSTITETIPALVALPERENGEGDGDGEGDDGGGDEETSSGAQATIGWIVGATGLVGVALGVGFGVNTFTKNDDSAEYCDEANLCNQQGVELRDAALTSATLSTVAFAIGGAALVAGIIVVVTAPSGDTPADDARFWIGPQTTFNGVVMNAGVLW